MSSSDLQESIPQAPLFELSLSVWHETYLIYWICQTCSSCDFCHEVCPRQTQESCGHGCEICLSLKIVSSWSCQIRDHEGLHHHPAYLNAPRRIVYDVWQALASFPPVNQGILGCEHNLMLCPVLHKIQASSFCRHQVKPKTMALLQGLVCSWIIIMKTTRLEKDYSGVLKCLYMYFISVQWSSMAIIPAERLQSCSRFLHSPMTLCHKSTNLQYRASLARWLQCTDFIGDHYSLNERYPLNERADLQFYLGRLPGFAQRFDSMYARHSPCQPFRDELISGHSLNISEEDQMIRSCLKVEIENGPAGKAGGVRGFVHKFKMNLEIQCFINCSLQASHQETLYYLVNLWIECQWFRNMNPIRIYWCTLMYHYGP